MMSFTSREIKDISISTIVLAFVFSTVWTVGFLEALFVMVVVFLTHELLGHKLVAQHFGCTGEYRKWTFGLIIAIIGSLVGFVFAAPGAVYINPGIRKKFAWTIHRLTKKEFGIIALAGPAVNIIFGFIFFFMMPYFPDFTVIIYLAARISFFLAFFNLLPFGPLDGAKIMAWSWKPWALAMLLAASGYYFLL